MRIYHTDINGQTSPDETFALIELCKELGITSAIEALALKKALTPHV